MGKVLLMVMFMAGGGISTETIEVNTMAQCEVLKHEIVQRFDTKVNKGGRKFELWVMKADCIEVPAESEAEEKLKVLMR